jgi:hypothetical protein
MKKIYYFILTLAVAGTVVSSCKTKDKVKPVTTPSPTYTNVGGFETNSTTFFKQFYNYNGNTTTSDSIVVGAPNITTAHSGTHVWMIKGTSSGYFLDGFGATGNGPFNLDMNDSIAFWVNTNGVAGQTLGVQIEDKKSVGSPAHGEAFAHQFVLGSGTTYVRLSVCIADLVSDIYQADYALFPTPHDYSPNLAAVDKIGFGGGTAVTSGPVEMYIDDIQFVRMP